MNIIEATTEAMKSGKKMTRRSWRGSTKVHPTKTCYDLITKYKNEKKRHPLWNPKTDDVLADDWILTD